jgi:hypothetical protein
VLKTAVAASTVDAEVVDAAQVEVTIVKLIKL